MAGVKLGLGPALARVDAARTPDEKTEWRHGESERVSAWVFHIDHKFFGDCQDSVKSKTFAIARKCSENMALGQALA
jgi:hypothetical protein